MKREVYQITIYYYKSQYHSSLVPSLKTKNVSTCSPEFLPQMSNFEKSPTTHMMAQMLIVY